MAFLTGAFPAAAVTTELDNTLLGTLPTIQVQRVDGDDDGFRLDRPLVDIDVYAADRAAASALAGSVRTAMLSQLAGSSRPGAIIGAVRTISAPSWRPYENTALRRSGATYELYLHPAA
ncbi:hypothetical protein [Kitasatospora phosalacinea]|uniref:DUF3168 domain-containing protein n=1 Tax=Kitasatospora phosalacinea TaxID=2065 RepID=A0ABW6GRE8_9ACTN